MTATDQTILIVDDIPLNITILKDILQNEYHIRTALSGADALTIVMSESIDLILLDVIMPGMDGYEVCKKIKSEPRTKDIPVIFISIMGEAADEALGLKLGAIDYIVKPITPSIVSARVKNHMDLKKHRDTLKKLSLLDGLTGVANRYRLDAFLTDEWSHALQKNQPLSFLLIDIDFFKQYNDCYGHLAGDTCLRLVADVLKSLIPHSANLVARYGGEEFSVVLPSTSKEKALHMAEKIRRSVESLRIPHPMSCTGRYLTVSIGAATVTPIAGMPRTFLIQQADDALYQAKDKGRNRVAASEG